MTPHACNSLQALHSCHHARFGLAVFAYLELTLPHDKTIQKRTCASCILIINLYPFVSYSYPNLRSHTSSPEPATYIAPNQLSTHHASVASVSRPAFHWCQGCSGQGVSLCHLFLFCYLFLSFWKLNDLQSQVLKMYRKMETIVFWDCGGFCFGKICPKVLTHFLVTTSSERKKSRQAKFALLRNHSLHVLMLAYLKSKKGMLQIVKANYGSASQVGDI